MPMPRGDRRIKELHQMRVIYFILPVTLILGTIGYLYLRLALPCNFTKGPLFALLFFLLAANNVGARLLPPGCPALLMQLSGFLSGLWIAFMYYFLWAGLLQLLLYLVMKLSGSAWPLGRLACYVTAFIACFICFGLYRAFSPELRQEEVETGKLAKGEGYRIVLLSDLHLGQINGRSYSEKLVARVNQLQPDLILIAGDILDEMQHYVDKEGGLAPLAQLQAPKGVYMAYGNHDYIDRPALWQQRLEAVGIHVLRNSSALVDGRLKLTGIEDYSFYRGTEAFAALARGNEAYYSIVLDHQPRRFAAASAAGYDLYLAGHTHTGQLFPNRQVTKRLYWLDYGRAQWQDLTAITSNGYGFWGPPVRTEVAPEYVLINLRGTG